MHSWRVLILPFLEQGALYNAYNFAEPWNGPNNARLGTRVGNIFRRPDAREDSVMTSFVAVVGPETGFTGVKSLKLEEIGDGTSKTIMFVEIANSDIHWMEPRDLAFSRLSFKVNDPRQPGGIGSTYGDVRIALMDGSVRQLKDGISPRVLRALLTASGGEPITLDEF
jgi:hypothetical protein